MVDANKNVVRIFFWKKSIFFQVGLAAAMLMLFLF
jgi:basic membrane lipoprotein Med (substrate-binding protein (PBP1-ABC) superfamily)